MAKSIFTNRKNKYNNKYIHALMDNKGCVYSFPTKDMTALFVKQNTHLEFQYQRFDSMLEFDRFKFLYGQQRQKVISDLRTQVEFELIPSQDYTEKVFMPNGVAKYKKRKMRGTKYIADFSYMRDGILVVEDTKSAITKRKPEYRMKKKLMLMFHNIVVMEVEKKWVNKL